jgi:hypothetical protein
MPNTVASAPIPHVAGWSDGSALEAVTEFAATIDTLARRVAEALAVEQVPVAA